MREDLGITRFDPDPLVIEPRNAPPPGPNPPPPPPTPPPPSPPDVGGRRVQR